MLRLLEISLDTNFSHNALKLVLRGVGSVLPQVCIQEFGSAHVVVLFATASTVFRLVLSHPEAIIKVDCPLVHHNIPQYTKVYHSIPKYTTVYCSIPQHSTVYHSIHSIPCAVYTCTRIIVYHSTPQYTIL